MSNSVNLNVELSNNAGLLALAAFCTAIANGSETTKSAAKPAAKMEAVKDETEAAPAKATPAPRAAAPAKATPAPRAAAPAKATPAKPDFSTLDTEAQLEAIKNEVTKHTKKGKSADIKALLGGWGVSRASELTEDQYQSFFDAAVGYGTGESVDALIEQFANAEDESLV